MADMRDDLNLDKKYIRRRLKVSCMEEQHKSNSMTQKYINLKELSSHDAESYIIGSEQGLKSKVIRMAFRNKEFIKKTPFIGKRILNVKNDILKKSIAKLNINTLDVSHYLEWYKIDFIKVIYEILLERKVDENGLNSCLHLMRQGASKGAIVYLIASSDEFGARGEVAYLKRYKKEYKRFILKQRIDKIPIFGKIFFLFTLKSQLSEIYDRIERNEALAEANIQKLLSAYDQFANSMHISNTKNLNMMNDRLESQVKEIKDRLNKNVGDIKEYVNESTMNIRKDVNVNYTNMSNDLNENIANISNNLNENIVNISNNLGLIQRIDTSISQKLDALPTYISQVGVKNKSVVTGVSGGITAVIVDDFIMGIPSEEWGLAMFLSLNGHFEIGTEKFFESMIKPDMTVLDIGANLGMFTLRALRAGCRVYAYEPTPSTYHILNQNIKANGYWESGRWNTFNLGAFNTHKFIEFFISDGMCGHNSIFEEIPNSKKIQIEMVALDDHLKDVKQVDIVKLDAEGSEYFILQGMKNIIANNVGIKIIMEFAPKHIERAGIEVQDILDLISDYDLKYRQINDITGELLQVSLNELVNVDSINLYLERR